MKCLPTSAVIPGPKNEANFAYNPCIIENEEISMHLYSYIKITNKIMKCLSLHDFHDSHIYTHIKKKKKNPAIKLIELFYLSFLKI
jgi:hypothetical protein